MWPSQMVIYNEEQDGLHCPSIASSISIGFNHVMTIEILCGRVVKVAVKDWKLGQWGYDLATDTILCNFITTLKIYWEFINHDFILLFTFTFT